MAKSAGQKANLLEKCIEAGKDITSADVPVVPENFLLIITPIHYMITSTRIFNAQGSCHLIYLALIV